MERNALFHQTQGISGGPVRRPGYIAQRFILCLDPFFFRQVLQMGEQSLAADPPEIIPLASGQHCDRNFMDFRGRQYKNHIGRRLLQSLQQSVERSRRQHVHLVNDVYAVFAFCGRIAHLIPDLSDIIHAIIGRGVNLYHVHRRSGKNCPASRTFVAGIPIHRMFAVHCPGKNFSHCSFAGPPCSAEQVRVADPPDAICGTAPYKPCIHLLKTARRRLPPGPVSF